MPKKEVKRLTSIVDRGVWEEVTKGRAGIRWGSVVEKVRKDVGGTQEEILSIEKYGGVEDRSKRKDRMQENTSAKK